MSVLPAAALEAPAADDLAAPVLHLVPDHQHTWTLRETEYDSGITVNRFECDACPAVRFT